jgi:hypothetical protein
MAESLLISVFSNFKTSSSFVKIFQKSSNNDSNLLILVYVLNIFFCDFLNFSSTLLKSKKSILYKISKFSNSSSISSFMWDGISGPSIPISISALSLAFPLTLEPKKKTLY